MEINFHRSDPDMQHKTFPCSTAYSDEWAIFICDLEHGVAYFGVGLQRISEGNRILWQMNKVPNYLFQNCDIYQSAITLCFVTGCVAALQNFTISLSWKMLMSFALLLW